MALPHESGPRKSRKGLKITAGILLILIATLAGVAVWQRNNIKAVQQFSQYSQEELEQQLQDNDQQVEEFLQAALEAARQVDAEGSQKLDAEVKTEVKVEAEPEPEAETPTEPETQGGAEKTAKPDVTPSAPSKSEEKAPASVSEVPKAETPQSKPAESKPVTQIPTADVPKEEKEFEPQQSVTTAGAYEQQLKDITDRVYALRAHFLQALDDLQAEAYAAYKAIPKDQRTPKAIASFVSTYISKANSMEKSCDAQMDALVAELTQLQKEYGLGMDLVESVMYTYANEKSLKKAWYMSELEKRGMI